MSFYSDMAATAHELITEFGASATLLSSTTSAYDGATGQATKSAPISRTVKAAVFDYAQRFIDGTFIRTGDKQAYVSTVGAGSPKPGDTLVWGGVSFSVIQAKPLAPALVAVLWELQVRGANG